MRLPTMTKRQAQEEDARILHEQLWDRVLDPTLPRLTYNSADPRTERLKVVGNIRRFWAARGYVLCSTANDAGYALWLEPKPVRAVA